MEQDGGCFEEDCLTVDEYRKQALRVEAKERIGAKGRATAIDGFGLIRDADLLESNADDKAGVIRA